MNYTTKDIEAIRIVNTHIDFDESMEVQIHCELVMNDGTVLMAEDNYAVLDNARFLLDNAMTNAYEEAIETLEYLQENGDTYDGLNEATSRVIYNALSETIKNLSSVS